MSTYANYYNDRVGGPHSPSLPNRVDDAMVFEHFLRSRSLTSPRRSIRSPNRLATIGVAHASRSCGAADHEASDDESLLHCACAARGGLSDGVSSVLQELPGDTRAVFFEPTGVTIEVRGQPLR